MDAVRDPIVLWEAEISSFLPIWTLFARNDFEIDKNKRLHQIEKFSNWEKSANTLIDALLGDKLE